MFTKLAALGASIAVIYNKVVKVIKSTKKLKKVKTELIEAYEAGEKAYNQSSETIEKIQGYFSSGSDGGKKLTTDELVEATKLLTSLTAQLKEAYTKGLEAKTEIMELIKEFKSK